MNTVVTSGGAILAACRKIVAERGLEELNMRSVAAECHVALGSLYNYFPSKDALVTATIQSVWRDILHMEQSRGPALPFPEYVAWIFESVRRGAETYPNFFTAHSVSLAGTERGRAAMEDALSQIKRGMLAALDGDGSVRKDAFTDAFTKSRFLDFVLTDLLALLAQRKEDCGILLEVIRRAIC